MQKKCIINFTELGQSFSLSFSFCFVIVLLFVTFCELLAPFFVVIVIHDSVVTFFLLEFRCYK